MGETWYGADDLRQLLVSIEALEPWEGNPRRGDVAAVAASLHRFGQVKPVVVDGARIVAGHHVVAGARAEGWTHVAALHHSFGSENEARAFLLADNRTSELGVVDEHLLAAQLREFDDTSLLGTGYDMAFVEALERELAISDLDALAAADDVSPLPVEPQSRRGEVYELGQHRLLCGDARDVGAVRALVGSCAPEMLWTDPPWGVDYVGKTSRALRIENDGAADLPGLLAGALAAADAVLAPGARFYIAAPSALRRHIEFVKAIGTVGWRIHQQLVWVKDTFVLGHADYHYRHEPILYGWKPGTGRVGRGKHPGSRWYSDHAQDSVFEIARPKRSVEHPTMKPVALVAAQLSNSTVRGDTVLDMFAGSGSTLIAFEQLERRCFAVEIDPAYCDVIRQRYTDR